MEPAESPKLTPKAMQTRQRILDAALRLFASQGYEQTTMRDIAAAAESSLGLTYRYFASKENLVLELYRWLVEQLEAQVRDLPSGSIADRFARVLRDLLTLMAPHRLTLGALFGAALNAQSRAGLFSEAGTEFRRRAHAAYATLVRGARDAPRAAQIDAIASLLYGLQLAVVLFWLQDHSADAQKTADLIQLLHDILKRLRLVLQIPWAATFLNRALAIVGPLLGQGT